MPDKAIRKAEELTKCGELCATTYSPHKLHSPSRHATMCADAHIAPFLLHHTSVRTLPPTHGNRHRGTWLQNKVAIQPLSSKKAAICTASFVARLRHPNVENFLGVVTTHSPSIVTDWLSGPNLANLPSISRHAAAMLALDVARAVVYVHAVAGPHGKVRAEEVVYDKKRERAVLLLSPGVGEGHRADDVLGLAKIVIKLFGGSRYVPTCLSPVLTTALGERKPRPSAEAICMALKGYQKESHSFG